MGCCDLPLNRAPGAGILPQLSAEVKARMPLKRWFSDAERALCDTIVSETMATPADEGMKVEAALHVEVSEDVEAKAVREPTVDARVAKKLGRKIDWRLLPMLSLV